jgi:hypothetical protein
MDEGTTALLHLLKRFQDEGVRYVKRWILMVCSKPKPTIERKIF